MKSLIQISWFKIKNWFKPRATYPCPSTCNISEILMKSTNELAKEMQDTLDKRFTNLEKLFGNQN